MIERRSDQVLKHVVIDTCAIWNVLSSRKLHAACAALGFHFAVAAYCIWECLEKPRKRHKPGDVELRARLEDARAKGQFQDHSLSVEDLQEMDVLRQMKSLGRGELATIALAKRFNIGAQTDDDGGEKLAVRVLSLARVQTTPHIVAWLFFGGHLADHELQTILDEHASVDGDIGDRFRAAYEQGLRSRLLGSTDST